MKLVIKIGTSSICDEKTHFPLLSNLASIIESVLKLKNDGHQVVLVTSAAIGTGLNRLNIAEKPSKLAAKQAVAAVGQGRLMALYDDLFSRFNQPVAQVLLTKNDLADQSQYDNAVACLDELLTMNVVPIVNENDTISTQGIRFGDNDTLSAIVAGMIKADYLFLMTDVDCLFTDNPRTNSDAKPVLVCDDIEQLKKEVSFSSAGSSLGTGGMETKLIAAELATAVGVTTVITHGSKSNNILEIVRAGSAETQVRYTRFTAKDDPLKTNKWWILNGLHTAGTIYVNEGAAKAILSDKLRSSLFAAGIEDVDGPFHEQQAVRIVLKRGEKEMEIGKGLVNYSHSEVRQIKGRRSTEFAKILGFINSECVIHRRNLARLTQDNDLLSYLASTAKVPA